MFVSRRADDERISIRLMNEYSAEIPLWTDEGHTDGEELGLSDALRSDLASFANRWEASIPDEASDDRFDGVPIMRWLVDARYSLRRFMNPAGRRAVAAEDRELRRLGEELRSRLERELGKRYHVTYQH